MLQHGTFSWMPVADRQFLLVDGKQCFTVRTWETSGVKFLGGVKLWAYFYTFYCKHCIFPFLEEGCCNTGSQATNLLQYLACSIVVSSVWEEHPEWDVLLSHYRFTQVCEGRGCTLNNGCMPCHACKHWTLLQINLRSCFSFKRPAAVNCQGLIRNFAKEKVPLLCCLFWNPSRTGAANLPLQLCLSSGCFSCVACSISSQRWAVPNVSTSCQ